MVCVLYSIQEYFDKLSFQKLSRYSPCKRIKYVRSTLAIFFSHTNTYNLEFPWEHNFGPSWPAAPAMGGIGMEEGTTTDEGAGRLYEYLDYATAALPHGMQLGDFQPPLADPATPTGMIMPATEQV